MGDLSFDQTDLETQLQQSQEDADRLQQKLHEKDAKLKQLQQDLEEQIRVNNNLQSQNSKFNSLSVDKRSRYIQFILKERNQCNGWILYFWDLVCHVIFHQTEFQKQQKQTPNITKEILPTDVEDNTIYASKSHKGSFIFLECFGLWILWCFSFMPTF